uniref:Uncharacterized protein n=1 Tax=viral metagenome TaxID=1070528 RepID=A0A6C0AD07_9ZZZZ
MSSNIMSLNIIIIGTCASEENPGHTPTLENIENSFLIASNEDMNLKITFVDPGFDFIQYVDSDSNEYLQNEKKKVDALKENVDFIEDFYYRSKLNFKKEDICIFVNYTKSSNNILTTYDFMHFIESWETENKYFYNPLDKNGFFDLYSIVKDYFGKQEKIVSPYDLYSGKKITDKIEQRDFNDVKKLMINACELNLWFLRAKYHLEETEIPIPTPSWTYNVEIPILKGLISYYGLYNNNQIHRPANEICESSDYRRTICIILCKVISNFAVNNGFIKLSEITNGWFSRATYNLIKDRLEEFEGDHNFVKNKGLRLGVMERDSVISQGKTGIY